MIGVCFNLLPAQDRIILDMSICLALRDNSLLTQQSVYSDKLHNMTLSEVYCVLLVLGPVLKACARNRTAPLNDALKLVGGLQQLVALTFWWPEEEIDDRNGTQYVHCGDGSYLSEFQHRANTYVQAVDEFISKHGESGAALDKPNLHRLLELYAHTVPAFGHALHCTELVFECAHSPLKRCLVRSNHSDVNVSAVEHCLANDWQARLERLHRLSKGGESKAQACAMKGLCRFLIGRQFDDLDATEDAHAAFISDAKKRIEALFIDPIKRHFDAKGNGDIIPIYLSKVWKGTGAALLSDFRLMNLDLAQVMKKCSSLIATVCKEFGSKDTPTEFWKFARRVLKQGKGETGKACAHDKLEMGSVIQAWNSSSGNEVVLRSNPSVRKTQQHLFAVLGIITYGQQTYAVVMPCLRREHNKFVSQKPVEREVKCLQLSGSVRGVSLYHVCDPRCVVDMAARTKMHSTSVLEGGQFRYQTRAEGYPPRMA